METPNTDSRPAAAPNSEVANRDELPNPLYREGNAHPLFQPDIILPSQYRDSQQRRTPQDPDKRLMLAILEDAVGCFRNGLNVRDHRRRELSKDSEAWIREENGDRLFSFEHVCDILGVDARSIRNELLKWQQETAKHEGQANILPLTRVSEESSSGPNRSAMKTTYIEHGV